jgi:hypothetical protein
VLCPGIGRRPDSRVALIADLVEAMSETEQDDGGEDPDRHEPDPQGYPIVGAVPARGELSEDRARYEVHLPGFQDDGREARPHDDHDSEDPDDTRRLKDGRLVHVDRLDPPYPDGRAYHRPISSTWIFGSTDMTNELA